MIRFSLGVFCLFFALSLPAWEVSKLVGTAKVKNSTQEKLLAVGDKLKNGDLIVTEKSTKLMLSLGEKKIWLGQKTKYKIREKKEVGGNSYFHQLVYGKVRSKVKKSENDESFKIHSKTAVAGVRGTEFFVQSDSQGEFVCTIHGEVEVKKDTSMSQEKTPVPRCAGVDTDKGRSVVIEPTSSFRIQRWLADTSVEQAAPVVRSDYSALEAPNRQMGNHWLYRPSVFFNFIQTGDPNYYSSTNSEKNRIGFARFSLDLAYQDDYVLQLGLRWMLGSSSEGFAFSKNGRESEEFQVIRLGETFFQDNFSALNWKLGLQSVMWNDGSLLAKDFWSSDGYLFPGLRLRTNRDIHFFDFLYFTEGDGGELTGQIPVELIGFKYDFMAYFNLYYLFRDYKAESHFASLSKFQNHLMHDLGMFAEKKYHQWDYRFDFAYQKGKRFGNQDHQGSRHKIEFGYYPWEDRNIRIGTSHLQASENYLPGFELPYLLGYSQILTRSNLQQFRLKWDHDFSDSWSYFFERIHSSSRFNNPSFVSWTGEDSILIEYDLGFTYAPKDSASKALVALFSAKPEKSWGSLFSNGEAMKGLIVNWQQSF